MYSKIRNQRLWRLRVLACSFLLSTVFLHILLHLNSIFKMLGSAPLSFVDITCRNKFFPPRKYGNSSAPLFGLLWRYPHTAPEYGQVDRHQLYVWRNNQIFSAWQVYQFSLTIMLSWMFFALKLLYEQIFIDQASSLKMARYCLVIFWVFITWPRLCHSHKHPIRGRSQSPAILTSHSVKNPNIAHFE